MFCKHNFLVVLTVMTVIAMSVIGCGKKSSETSGGKIVTNVVSAVNTTSASLRLFRAYETVVRWFEPKLTWASGTAIGQTTSTSITSLQYYIREIQLCEDMQLNGSGYSGTTNCITLYASPDKAASSEYDTYTVTEAMNDTNPDHFVDFLSKEGKAKLASQPLTLSSSMVRSYKYGKIDFSRPIKIKAEFIDPSGSVVAYSKTTSASNVTDQGTDSGGRQLESVTMSNTTTAPAEVMTYMLNNGGTWFPFLKPFEITQSDVDNKTEINIDFVFNPANFASATKSTSCSSTNSNAAVYDPTNCVAFELPYAKMAPVPRKEGETIKKEVYYIDYVTTTESRSKLRVELYYNSADSTKAIQGVDIASVAQSGATTSAGNIVQAYKVTDTNNVVSFIGWNSATNQIDATTLTGLTRRQDGTVTIYCYFTGGVCSTSNGSETLTRSYVYEGDKTVSSE